MYITGVGRRFYYFKFVPGPSIHKKKKKRIYESCIMVKYVNLFCKEGRLTAFVIKAKEEYRLL